MTTCVVEITRAEMGYYHVQPNGWTRRERMVLWSAGGMSPKVTRVEFLSQRALRKGFTRGRLHGSWDQVGDVSRVSFHCRADDSMLVHSTWDRCRVGGAVWTMRSPRTATRVYMSNPKVSCVRIMKTSAICDQDEIIDQEAPAIWVQEAICDQDEISDITKAHAICDQEAICDQDEISDIMKAPAICDQGAICNQEVLTICDQEAPAICDQEGIDELTSAADIDANLSQGASAGATSEDENYNIITLAPALEALVDEHYIII